MELTEPFRLELWRVDPPRMLTSFVVPPGGQLCYRPPPWAAPEGWPHGFEWRRFSAGGIETDRCPCDRATPWVTYEDPNADVDRLPDR